VILRAGKFCACADAHNDDTANRVTAKAHRADVMGFSPVVYLVRSTPQ